MEHYHERPTGEYRPDWFTCQMANPDFVRAKVATALMKDRLEGIRMEERLRPTPTGE